MDLTQYVNNALTVLYIGHVSILLQYDRVVFNWSQGLARARERERVALGGLAEGIADAGVAPSIKVMARWSWAMEPREDDDAEEVAEVEDLDCGVEAAVGRHGPERVSEVVESRRPRWWREKTWMNNFVNGGNGMRNLIF